MEKKFNRGFLGVRERAAIVVKVSLILILTTITMSASALLDSSKVYAKEPIRIGVLAPLSFTVGKTIKAAAEVAKAHLAEEYGQSIELFFGDTELNPQQGVRAFQDLAFKNKIDFVIGFLMFNHILDLTKQRVITIKLLETRSLFGARSPTDPTEATVGSSDTTKVNPPLEGGLSWFFYF